MSEPTMNETGATQQIAIAAEPGFEAEVTTWRVIRSEWTKALAVRGIRILLVVNFLLIAGLAVLLALTISVDEVNDPYFDLLSRSLETASLAQVTFAALGVLIVTHEYGTGLIRTTLTAVPRRIPVLVGKAVVVSALTLIVGGVSLIIAYLASGMILSKYAVTASLADPGVLATIGGTTASFVATALVSLAVGLMLRSTAGGVAVMILALFAAPIALALLPADFGEAVGPYWFSDVTGTVMHPDLDSGQLSYAQSAAVLLAYVVVLLTAAGLLLKRRDA